MHIDRAIVEGVTFALRDSFELIKNLGISIERVRITGGGAKSNIWSQMISDVFNVKVAKIQTEEGPALGAAILAMVGCNEYNNIREACENIVKISEEFVPIKEHSEQYNAKYKKFVSIYPQIKVLFN